MIQIGRQKCQILTASQFVHCLALNESLGFFRLYWVSIILSIIMEENNTLRKNRVYERKGVIPKEASTSKTKGPMPGAAQVENFLKKANFIRQLYQHI